MISTGASDISGGVEPRRRVAPAAGWYAVGLLAACFTFSYIDRQILSLLVTPVKASLGLSDTQIGLLQGVSFSIFYVAAALPLARLADRRNRSHIMAGCVGVWSVMTMLCGMAGSFWHLMAARIGVAVGEAGLPPSALTLMADLFDRANLARATAIFMLAPFVGGGIALVGGGALYAASADWAMPVIPGIGAVERWQAVFILVGLPGLILAPLILLTLRDPRVVRPNVENDGSLRKLWAFMFSHWRFCGSYILAISLMVTLLNAHIAWMPSGIIRTFALDEAAMGARFGPIYLVAGASGTIVAGWLVARGDANAMLTRTLRLMRLGAMILLVPALGAPLLPTLPLMLASLAVAIFCTSAIVSMGSIPFQIIAPTDLRAQTIAVTSLAAALFGTGLGPLLVGMLSDAAAALNVPHPLMAALSLVGGVTVSIVIVLLSIAINHRGGVAPRSDQQETTHEDGFTERVRS